MFHRHNGAGGSDLAGYASFFDGSDPRAFPEDVEYKPDHAANGVHYELSCPKCRMPCRLHLTYREMLAVANDLSPGEISAEDQPWQKDGHTGMWYPTMVCLRCSAPVRVLVSQDEANAAVETAKRLRWFDPS